MHKTTYWIIGGLLVFNLVVNLLEYDCVFEKIHGPTFFVKLVVLLALALAAGFCIFLFSKIRDRHPWKGKGLVFSSLIVLFFWGIKTVNAASRLPIVIKQFTRSSSHASLCTKIISSDHFFNGIKAIDLTFNEYLELKKYHALPDIDSSAAQISYLYAYEGFLPDYNLSLEYQLPLGQTVESFQSEKGALKISQTSERKEDYTLVSYSEYRD